MAVANSSKKDVLERPFRSVMFLFAGICGLFVVGSFLMLFEPNPEVDPSVLLIGGVVYGFFLSVAGVGFSLTGPRTRRLFSCIVAFVVAIELSWLFVVLFLARTEDVESLDVFFDFSELPVMTTLYGGGSAIVLLCLAGWIQYFQRRKREASNRNQTRSEDS